ncbi:MAG TPA: hypothetical protein VHZ24_13260 [Pirellulales bacterium]|jgi:hypothetical protein|nr:hypothetical protein [Pirellulales bacterium]
MFDAVESLKRQYTDKYVVVDESRPELARFHGQTGQVKTVNMSGRALVEFDAYNNIGWYDIDPTWLRVVEAPLPKPAEAEKKPEKKAPEKTKPNPEPAAPENKSPDEAARAAGAGKKSTADVLAAARAKIPAPPAAASPKPSTADILAAARAKSAGGAAPAAAPPKPKAPPPPPPPPEPEPEPEPVVAAEPEPEPVPPPAPQAAPAKAAGGPVPTTTAEKIAWCREHDKK